MSFPFFDTPDSGPALDCVKNWLKECTMNHKACKHNKSPQLPARVIDLGDGKTRALRLVETQQESGTYVALSHCWGPESHQPLRTVAGNLESLKVKIPESQLNKTFLDAIEVCRHLGVRYLWIDSLCIIQDSLEDWFVAHWHASSYLL